MDIKAIVEDYMQRGLSATENANTSFGPNGLLAALGGVALAEYTLDRMHEDGHGKLADLHDRGYVHIHDLNLGLYTPYCCGHSLSVLLEEGFQSGFVFSSPAKRLRTACGHIVGYIGAASNEWAGAQAFNDIDIWLAPYLYAYYLDMQQKWGLTPQKALQAAVEEARQCMQEMIFPLNLTTRYGMQSPFTNISLSLGIPDDMKNRPVLINGNKRFIEVYPQANSGVDLVYGDLEQWADMIAEAVLFVLSRGDGRRVGFTFPVLNLNLTERFWNHPLKAKILKVTAKFGSPQFTNYVNGLSGGKKMDPADVRSMCCRLQLNLEELTHAGGAFGNADQTGSLQVVTTNTPMIAAHTMAELADYNEHEKGKKSKHKKTYSPLDAFLRELTVVLDQIHEQHKWKRAIIEQKFAEGFYQTAASNFRQGLKHFYTTIGYVGLWETVQILTDGKEDLSTPKGLEMGRIIEQFYADKCREYSKNGCKTNFEATPAESAAHKLALKALKVFPEIPVQGMEEGAPFFCNSCHLPPAMQGRVDVALESQNLLQPIHTGGTTYHYHTNEELTPEGVEALLRMFAETNMPQFTISPVYSICPACGARFAGDVTECPNQHTEEQITRVKKLHPELVSEG